jgi:hypothetical protein
MLIKQPRNSTPTDQHPGLHIFLYRETRQICAGDEAYIAISHSDFGVDGAIGEQINLVLYL